MTRQGKPAARRGRKAAGPRGTKHPGDSRAAERRRSYPGRPSEGQSGLRPASDARISRLQASRRPGTRLDGGGPGRRCFAPTPHHDACHLGIAARDDAPTASAVRRADREEPSVNDRGEGSRPRRRAHAWRPGEGRRTGASDGDTGAFAKGEPARVSSCGDGTSSRRRRRRASRESVGTLIAGGVFRRAAFGRGSRNGECSGREVRVANCLDGNLRGSEAALRALALFRSVTQRRWRAVGP